MRPDSSYWALVVPAHALTGIGLGIMFNSGSNTATLGLATSDTGIGAAVYSTFQQLGGATGTALMNTIATSATAAWLLSHPAGAGQSGGSAAGTVHGYSVAFWASSAISSSPRRSGPCSSALPGLRAAK